MRSRIAVIASVIVLSVGAAAAPLQGVLKNLTSGTPGAGDQVALISLEGGMQEIVATRSDASGRFHVDLPETRQPMLVRVTHDGVGYYAAVTPGASTVEIDVYDAVRGKLEGVAAAADGQLYQSQRDTLEVMEVIVLRNLSKPPRTLLSDHPLEINLPEDAEVDSASVQYGKGMPLKASELPGSDKIHRYFQFPIRPGETRLKIVYRLPYGDERLISPRITMPVGAFLVALPKSMSFQPSKPGLFTATSSGEDGILQVTPRVSTGQDVSFRLSGTGVISDPRVQAEARQGAAEANRPGGGLGAPIAKPDPLYNVRWYVLGVLSLALAIGGVRMSRKPASLRLQQAGGTAAVKASKRRAASPGQPRSGRGRATNANAAELRSA